MKAASICDYDCRSRLSTTPCAAISEERWASRKRGYLLSGWKETRLCWQMHLATLGLYCDVQVQTQNSTSFCGRPIILRFSTDSSRHRENMRRELQLFCSIVGARVWKGGWNCP